jgi:signal transduction histidine kinase
MTARGIALVLAASSAAAAVAGAIYGRSAAIETGEILIPVGALAVLGASILVQRRELAGGLRRQVLGWAALVVGQLVVVVALLAWRMLVSPMDVLFTVVVVTYSSLIGLWVARALAARVMADVEAVGAGLLDVGDGARVLKIETGARDEIAGLARELECMTAKLGAEEHARAVAESARLDLLVAVSHDLRTPVASIRAMAEAIDEEVVDGPTQREYMSRLALHTRSLSALLDDLFELCRLEAGDIRWTAERVEVGGLVEETVEAMRPQADANAIGVRFDLPPRHTYARANPEQIQRVLFNLLQNAIRHTPADGSVTVRAEQLDHDVEIEVADTGEGIEAEDRVDVFEAFVQGRARAARTNGSAGLGLAIARAVVEAHGGRIWLADAAVGTRVRFSLPGAARARAV